MSVCEKLNGCPFYTDKMSIESGLGKIYKRKYCEENKEICARYKVSAALGPDKVPTDLYPNMFERAEEILKR